MDVGGWMKGGLSCGLRFTTLDVSVTERGVVNQSSLSVTGQCSLELAVCLLQSKILYVEIRI